MNSESRMPSGSRLSFRDEDRAYVFSDDPLRLDRDWIAASIQGSYWGGHYTRKQIGDALNGSLVIGAYVGIRQIGFVRIVTDAAIFSSATDVFVDEEWRGRGVGSSMMEYAVAHPQVSKTMCILQARPLAVLWYMKFGFRVVDPASGIMQRMPR